MNTRYWSGSMRKVTKVTTKRQEGPGIGRNFMRSRLVGEVDGGRRSFDDDRIPFPPG